MARDRLSSSLNAPTGDPIERPPERPSRRLPHIVGPVVLVGLGMLLLLNNVNVVPWAVWQDIWPFWPVLFILLGLEALITGRLSWGGLVLTTLVVVGGSIVGATAFFHDWDQTDAPAGSPSAEFHQELGGATRALARVRYGAGTLMIGPSQDNRSIAEGELYRAGGEVDVRYEVRDGIGQLLVQPRGSRPGFRGFDGPSERLDLRLNPAIPLDLRVEVGAANALLDLRDLRLSDLRVETGASRARIELPEHGQVRAAIDGGATDLTVVVPPNVAARITVDQGLSSVTVDERRFPLHGSEYRSVDYDTAVDRVDLIISVGAARVNVQ